MIWQEAPARGFPIAMTTLFSILITLGGGYVITMNYLCIFVSLRNARRGIDRHHSLAPLAGPALMIAGLGTLVPNIGWFLLLPALIDPGTWILVYSLPRLARELT